MITLSVITLSGFHCTKNYIGKFLIKQYETILQNFEKSSKQRYENCTVINQLIKGKFSNIYQ
jgi:hypothetical protein